MPGAGARLKHWARTVRRDIHAIYLASRDPRVPWYAKALAIGVVAYAVSPIDLIPDFIPVLGYLDDLILLPLGVVMVVRLIPPGLMAEHRAAADTAMALPQSSVAAIVIAAIWIALTLIAGWLIYRWLWA